jgi:hypothetical protein
MEGLVITHIHTLQGVLWGEDALQWDGVHGTQSSRCPKFMDSFRPLLHMPKIQPFRLTDSQVVESEASTLYSAENFHLVL